MIESISQCLLTFDVFSASAVLGSLELDNNRRCNRLVNYLEVQEELRQKEQFFQEDKLSQGNKIQGAW